MLADPIPPGHGEPEPRSFGRGSNTYSDEDWQGFGDWLREVSVCPAKDEELIDFA